jgi:hypothetical protein
MEILTMHSDRYLDPPEDEIEYPEDFEPDYSIWSDRYVDTFSDNYIDEMCAYERQLNKEDY